MNIIVGELNETELQVIEAYAGETTMAEAYSVFRGDVERETFKKLTTALTKKDYLVDLNPEARGPVSHRWKPSQKGKQHLNRNHDSLVWWSIMRRTSIVERIPITSPRFRIQANYPDDRSCPRAIEG